MNRNHDTDILAIKALHVADAPGIAEHLSRLSADDRALRFNSALIDDTELARYVQQIRFGEDLVMGLVDASGRIVGLAQGCAFKAGTERRIEAAFSIDAAYRGRGLGSALMESLQAAAAKQGVASIVGVCAARNRPMRRIFERAGMSLEREGDEMQGTLGLDKGTPERDAHMLSGRSGKRPPSPARPS